MEKYHILTKEEADFEHHQKHDCVLWHNRYTGAQYVDFLDGELLLLDGLKIGKLKHWKASKREIEIVKKIFGISSIDEKNIYILYNITIDPLYRRKGHGVAFYNIFQEQKKQEGYLYLAAWRVKREEALNFFKKMGFDLRKVPETIYPDLGSIGLRKIA